MKHRKTDAVNPDTTHEAVRRSTIRFVEIMSGEQQAILSIHRTRGRLVPQRFGAPRFDQLQDADGLTRTTPTKSRNAPDLSAAPLIAKPFGTSLAERIRARGGGAAMQTGRTHDRIDEMRTPSRKPL